MKLIRYARREPTTDPIIKRYDPNSKRFDVQLYTDKEATHPYARFMWDSLSKPRRNTKSATVNCYQWSLQWID